MIELILVKDRQRRGFYLKSSFSIIKYCIFTFFVLRSIFLPAVSFLGSIFGEKKPAKVLSFSPWAPVNSTALVRFHSFSHSHLNLQEFWYEIFVGFWSKVRITLEICILTQRPSQLTTPTKSNSVLNENNGFFSFTVYVYGYGFWFTITKC